MPPLQPTLLEGNVQQQLGLLEYAVADSQPVEDAVGAAVLQHPCLAGLQAPQLPSL